MKSSSIRTTGLGEKRFGVDIQIISIACSIYIKRWIITTNRPNNHFFIIWAKLKVRKLRLEYFFSIIRQIMSKIVVFYFLWIKIFANFGPGWSKYNIASWHTHIHIYIAEIWYLNFGIWIFFFFWNMKFKWTRILY